MKKPVTKKTVRPESPNAPAPSARGLALEALDDILARKRPLDEVLPSAETLPAARDRAFLRLLLATTLRRLGRIDSLIDTYLEKPLPPNLRLVRHVLRLGAAQLLYLDTPAHAAVDTAVELIKARGVGTFKGLVNAVLRRIDREGRDTLSAQDGAHDSAGLDTPGWLWRNWTGAYGEAVARKIAAAHLVEPPLDLAVKKDAALWAQRLEARLLPTGALRRANANVAELPGFAEGAWWVQDAAAQLPVRLLGDLAGKNIVDLCAAPGGKTMQLAAGGAHVTAVDRSDKRLALVRDNLARTGLAAETVAADANLWRPAKPADAVLLDAPCSATGTLRRHPDIAYLKDESDIAKLAAAQDRLLAAAAEMVRPGGILVYCVCSLAPEEGKARVDAALAALPLERLPVRAEEIGGLEEAVSEAGDLLTLPYFLGDLGGMDGFYAARLIRK